MRDKKSDKRFIISLFVSIFIHIFIILFVYILLQNTTPIKPKFTKVDASNLLVLKRGHSQDPTKNKPGVLPKTVASAVNQSQTSAFQRSNLPMKKNPIRQKQGSHQEEESLLNKQDQQKKQIDSHNKALNKYNQTPIDPRNLSFLSPQQILALQNSSGSRGLASVEVNKGTDVQTRQEIDDLYGEEFGDLGSAEKDFIRNNLRDIGRITQRYLERLGYPKTAAYLGQDGQNATEFYLHPNGDISDLKVLTKSGSIILDRNTIKTVEIAYKDYPRPSVRTLIRIRVKYFMY